MVKLVDGPVTGTNTRGRKMITQKSSANWQPSKKSASKKKPKTKSKK